MATETVALALIGFAIIAAALGWSPLGRSGPVRGAAAPATAGLLVVSLLIVAIDPGFTAIADPSWVLTLAYTLALVLAVVGGGPITTWVFSWVDRHDRADRTQQANPTGVQAAGAILRGGAWIGALERAAVFISLTAGSMEGLAIALALKGLGRYPELKSGDNAGTAERFIIGTFTSVLWAAGCAAFMRLL